MKLIYVKTDEISLDSFLKFIYNKMIINCGKNKNDFNRIWKNSLVKKMKYCFENSEYLVINNRGDYIGCLEYTKEEIKSDIYIWNIEDIDLVNSYEVEYFDFEKWNIIVNDEKFKINRVGINTDGVWNYIEVENKFTHYRSFILNLKTFTNIKKYIRHNKIKNLLENF
jgi:hypothetical protein